MWGANAQMMEMIKLEQGLKVVKKSLSATNAVANATNIMALVVISIHIRGMDKGYTCPFVSRMES